MKPVILFRGRGPEYDAEASVAECHLPLYRNRTEVPPGSLVVGRYSTLPFHAELEADVRALGSQLINSTAEHGFCASLPTWAARLGDLTPRTWTRLEDVDEPGPFVLKGETNSRRDQWRTMMYAENRQEALETYLRLQDDGLIGSQRICVRRYVPLQCLTTALNGMPIGEEYRFFVLDNEVLAGGFYWSTHADDLPDGIPSALSVPQDFLDRVIGALSGGARFYAMDVARTAAGSWVVIEVNDGTMSGLSDISPQVFYGRLAERLGSR